MHDRSFLSRVFGVPRYFTVFYRTAFSIFVEADVNYFAA